MDRILQLLHLAETANAPLPWLIFARRLVSATVILAKHTGPARTNTDVRNVASMCMGMALECYLKAYYVSRGGILHDGKRFKTLGGHRLVDIAKAVGFAVTPEQERVLHYLSMWVHTKGRYPVPLNPEAMAVHPADSKGPDQFFLHWDERSEDVCMELVKLAEARIAEGRAV